MSVFEITGILSFDLFFSIFVYVIIAIVPVMLAVSVLTIKFFR